MKEGCFFSWRPQFEGPETTFSEAYRVMNRHLYGETHGVSVRTLHRYFELERNIINSVAGLTATFRWNSIHRADTILHDHFGRA